MQDSVSTIPASLAALLDRGLVPHASLIVGSTNKQRQAITQTICGVLSVATADCLSVTEVLPIKDLRPIIARLHFKPFQSELSILALYQLDAFNEDSANLLLKTLEEPPAHARILLFADHDEGILRTILSRVARFRLPTRIGIDQTIELPNASLPLAQQFAWSKEYAKSEGSTAAALSALVSSAHSPQSASQLLAYASDIGNHPVNARLALDTALLIRHNQR